MAGLSGRRRWPLWTASVAAVTAAVVAAVTALTACTVSQVGEANLSAQALLPDRTLRGRALPAGGTWFAYDPAKRAETSRPAQMLVRPTPRPCRPGTTNYPAPNQRFSCMGYYADNGNAGHPVLLRRGAADPAGFGYLHALVDHGLDEESIATVIVNNAAGIRSGDRFLYGLEYRVADVGIVAVEVYEERRPPNEISDGDGLGVVTAFCKGFTGPCPEGINESLP